LLDTVVALVKKAGLTSPTPLREEKVLFKRVWVLLGAVMIHREVMTMKQRRLFAALLLAALAALALAGPASAAKLGGADHGGRLFTTTLSGAEEVDPETGALGAGDPDGSGLATLTVNPGQMEVCYELSVEDIMLPAIGAHIHVGAAGENGPVVVPLIPPDASGVSSGCEEVSRELALAIIQDPEGYYVNVHTSDFPNGAIRGQLSK
jgi:hypothetical protein